MATTTSPTILEAIKRADATEDTMLSDSWEIWRPEANHLNYGDKYLGKEGLWGTAYKHNVT